MQEGQSQRQDGPLGVIVVHGLGDADRGAVVRELMKPLEQQDSGVDLAETYETRVLLPQDDPTDEGASGRAKMRVPSFAVEAEEFAYTQRRGRLASAPEGRGDVVFGEMFWSDTKAGRKSSLPAIFLLLAEILHGHYILGALQRTRGSFFSTATMYFLSWISWLIRGPILAASVLIIAALFWNSTLGELGDFGPASGRNPLDHMYFMWLMGIVALFALGVLFVSRVRGTFYRTGAYWTLFFSLLALIVGVSMSAGGVAADGGEGAVNPRDLYGYVSWSAAAGLLAIGLVQFLLLFFIFVLMALAAPVSLFSRRASAFVRTTLLGLGIVALQWNLWNVFVSPFRLNSGVEGSVAPLDPAVTGGRPDDLSFEQETQLLLKAVEGGQENRVSLMMNVSYAELSIFFMVIMFVVFARFIFSMLQPRFQKLSAPRVLFNGTAVTSLVLAKFVAVTISFLAMVVGVFVHIAALNDNVVQVVATAEAPGAPAGSKIAVDIETLKDENRFIDGVFEGRLDVQLVDEPTSRFGENFRIFNRIYDYFVVFSREYIGFAVALLIPLAAMFFMRPIGYAASVLEDINNYNSDERRPRRLWWRWLPERRLFQRRRIAARYRAALSHMLDQERISRLLIVSHSQGTVITFDFAKEMAAACAERGVRLDIITMGSPLKHIYQHYFAEYEAVDGEIEGLKGAVASWRNFYAYDDPIGTTLNDDRITMVEDVNLGRGGHFIYWTHPKLRDAVKEAMAQ